jgi:hypothetical protein
MSKKLNFAPVVVVSTVEESETLEAQAAKANEKTTPSVRKNMIYRFIKDFSVVNIDGLSHLCIGGAISIDRKHRTLGYSYWENEGVSFIDPVRFDGLDIDVIITHTAPNVAPPTTFGELVRHYAMNDVDLIRDLQLERNEVDKVFEKFKGEKPIKWVYGHFHDTFRFEVNNFRFYGLGVNELLDLI